MKSKISYRTDPITINKAAIAATAMNVSIEEIARRAIVEFASFLESEQRNCKEGRSIAKTVDIDGCTERVLQEATMRTGLTQSTVIHKCLKKYLEFHKQQIRLDFELLRNRLNLVAQALAA
ncbi:hypothetical protein [Nostoc sp.]|uniref:hypothetical protein n=1 Tax=Nostoc sp. TaxID=1180 RepID=UPI002FF8F01E